MKRILLFNFFLQIFLPRFLIAAQQVEKGIRQPLSSVILCNGSKELCYRRYNEVAYPTSHNIESYKGASVQTFGISVQNQDLPITEQLKRGIRAMKIPLHKSKGVIKGCHGIQPDLLRKINILVADPCAVDNAAVVLQKILEDVKNFLDHNPGEVITIFFEDTTQDHRAIYMSFIKSGIENYLHTQNPEKSWPTLGDMIKNNKRLVVFIDSDDRVGTKFPGFHKTGSFRWQTRFSFGNLKQLSDYAAEIIGEKTNENYLDRFKLPRNKISVIQHFITPSSQNGIMSVTRKLGGDRELSKKANKREIMEPRFRALLKKVGVPLNFIWADFIEYGDLFDIVDELNAVGNHKDKKPFYGLIELLPAEIIPYVPFELPVR